MLRAGRMLLAGLALMSPATAFPSLAAAPPAVIGGVSDGPENFLISLGRKISPPPVLDDEFSSIASVTADSLADAGPIPVAPPVQGAPALPAPDQVSALTIVANQTYPGPAWWKATKGASTVWIMGTPDLMPLDTAWDDRGLVRHLAPARGLILPARYRPVLAEDDFISSPTNTPQVLTRSTPLTLPTTSLAQRLPAALLDRLRLRVVYDEAAAQGQLHYLQKSAHYMWQPLSPLTLIRRAPNELSPTLVVATRLAQTLNLPGELGNPVARRAQALATQRKLPIKILTYTMSDMYNLAYFVSPPEAAQQACLSRVLDQLDTGQTAVSLVDALNAWSDADPARALKRESILGLCDYGPTGQALWNAVVLQTIQAIDAAQTAGGETVAIVELDPLLIKGGVLERLAANGWTITPPEES